MKNTITQLFAVLLVLISVTTALVWEFYFDDKFNTILVYQAASRMPRGHKVLPSDLSPVRIKLNALPEGAVKNVNIVLGKEAVIPIGKGTILVTDFFDSPEIVPNKNQMIAPIPNQWIYSLPGSLRRKDKVAIYEFPVNSLNEVINRASPEFPAPQRANPHNIQKGHPIFENIVVAFAKDSANQEVKASNDKLHRLDATGNISQLELILTPKQFETLEAKALNGYKFVFTYR